MSTDPKDRWLDLGSFIREQRGIGPPLAAAALRAGRDLQPYLSQIERGLRRPSAEILQQIAKALRISAETLYVQAGILEAPDGVRRPDPADLADQSISEDQKQALVRIYLSFRREYERRARRSCLGRARPSTPPPPPRARSTSRPIADTGSEAVGLLAGENGPATGRI